MLAGRCTLSARNYFSLTGELYLVSIQPFFSPMKSRLTPASTRSVARGSVPAFSIVAYQAAGLVGEMSPLVSGEKVKLDRREVAS